ncbi:MAG TPA: zinc-dependent metalloprotease [Pirellulales bacterium]|nr:zinc-dependent metalloprotease [Pirellulales bacterium]
MTRHISRLAMGLLLAVSAASVARAEDTKSDAGAKTEAAAAPDTVKAESSSSTSTSSSTTSSTPKSKYPSYADTLKDFKAIDGLIKLHQKENKVYAEISSSDLNRDFIVLTSIARGIGEGPLLGGMTWGFGDDVLWQFRKVEDHIQIVRRNVRFRAAKGSPEEKAVKLAYTDSVLFALPIVTVGSGGSSVVDLGQVFMSDLPQIGQVLPGFSFSPSKSTWSSVKGFHDNVELEVAATYSSSGANEIETVPDSRGVSIYVHYSISLLPDNGYTPRLADDRVGYFLTAVKDFSLKNDQDRFVRYINRWDLQKADASADVSPPKKPIIFWLEKTVPYQYRAAIRDGIQEWNKAFEKAGFSNAIEVRQQPDNADWDPEDVNYNTFRWITAGAGFAMGPSRVNPTNGQILDADIIFDADFVQFWKREYETFTTESIAALTGGPLDVLSYEAQLKKVLPGRRHEHLCQCELHSGMARELALGATALAATSTAAASTKEQQKMLLQGLKEVTMHELGHTLGLRHNFKASTYLTLAELNDTDKTKDTGLVASVMDYAPTNIMPKGSKQGDYYSTTIGPYDYWAIEYGYKPFSSDEAGGLKKIASRSGEPALVYATDEDTRGIDPDPLSNRFDLGRDPIEYANARTKLVGQLWPGVVEKVTAEGEGYQRARQAFGILLGNYGQSVFMAARYIGGLDTSRSHKGDKDAKPPVTVVSAAKQRAALSLIEETILTDKPFEFPPELYNHLASTRWSHWGVITPTRSDYAVHDVINMWQSRVLEQLLSPTTLDRLHDSELKVERDEDALTTAELISRLTKSIFAETENGKLAKGKYTNREPAISSIRRNLQRTYLKRLANIALGAAGAPEDCQTVAYLELEDLHDRLEDVLKQRNDLDTYTKAHLRESADRIEKVLDARLTFTRP